MPSVSHLVAVAQEALLLALTLSLPAVAVAAAIGVLLAILQTATGIADSSFTHLSRLVAVVATLTLLGPWMGHQIAAFAVRLWSGG